jgi:hypothetical protein
MHVLHITDHSQCPVTEGEKEQTMIAWNPINLIYHCAPGGGGGGGVQSHHTSLLLVLASLMPKSLGKMKAYGQKPREDEGIQSKA